MIIPMVHQTRYLPSPLEFAKWLYAKGFGGATFKIANGHWPLSTGAAREFKAHTPGKAHPRPADIEYFELFRHFAKRFGLTAGAWVYVTPWDARAQGAHAGRLCEELRIDELILDPEGEFENIPIADAWAAAIEYWEGLASRLPKKTKVGTTTFCPRGHSDDFPFFDFINDGDFYAPQPYSENAARQIDDSEKMAKRLGVKCAPVFRAYRGDDFNNKAAILESTRKAVAKANELGIEKAYCWQAKTLLAWPEMVEVLQGFGKAAPAEEPWPRPIRIRKSMPGDYREIDAVCVLQKFLNHYFGTDLVVDGWYGPKTAAALEAAFPRTTSDAIKILKRRYAQ